MTQYEFLRRNYGFSQPKPNIYEKCPYYEWSQNAPLGAGFDWVHLQNIKIAFETAVSYPDLMGTTLPTDHFDMENYIIRTNKQLLISRQNLITSLKTSSPAFDSIRYTLGRMIHTLQDFYSNTNWVELGNDIINPNVGMSENLGIQINSGIACKICQQGFTPTEEHDIDMAYGSDAAALNTIGNRSNIFSCTDNVVTNYLTSGYRSAEASFSSGLPAGKCSSGGRLAPIGLNLNPR